MPLKMISYNCPVCGNVAEKQAAHYRRAIEGGYKVYCSRECSGLGRRCNKSKEQKRAEKSAYDKEYRAKNMPEIKRRKQEYFKKTYDPVQAAIERKKRMPRHVEYCRRPEYKKYKQQYDKQYHARKNYGEFAEAALALNQLENELDTKQIKYDNKLYNKAQKRKRQWKN